MGEVSIQRIIGVLGCIIASMTVPSSMRSVVKESSRGVVAVGVFWGGGSFQ